MSSLKRLSALMVVGIALPRIKSFKSGRKSQTPFGFDGCWDLFNGYATYRMDEHGLKRLSALMVVGIAGINIASQSGICKSISA